MGKRVLYRLDIDYLSKDYDNWACSTSSPIYNLKDGLREYKNAINNYCIDDKTKPVRVHLWKYGKPDPDGWYRNNITIIKNY